MSDYGLAAGLSVKLPWDQMIHEEQQNYVMNQQKRLMAEQKAKMFADDTDYQNVMNDFDNPRIKDYALKQVGLLGNFMKDNPGWETNPQARIVYNQIKKNLKDNPELNRGLLTEANFKKYQDYVHDPKNAEIVNSPEFKQVNDQWNNYRKYGNQYGETGLSNNGVQPFMFTAPEDVLDTTKLYKEYGNAMTQSDVKSDNKYWRLSTAPKDVEDAANALLSNPLYRKRLENEYQRVGNTKFKNINEMVEDGLSAWQKPDQVHKIDNAGDAYKWAKLKSLSESDGTNVLQEAAKTAKDLYNKNQGNEVPFKGDAIAYIHGAKNGLLNTEDVIFPKSIAKGKTNLGLVKATPKEKLRYKGKDINGNDVYVAPYDVQLSREQFLQKFPIGEDKMGELDSALDGTVDNDFSGYRNTMRREPVVNKISGETILDKNGNPMFNYIFEVEKPVGINKWNANAANAEYKVPTKQRSDEMDIESGDGKITISGF